MNCDNYMKLWGTNTRNFGRRESPCVSDMTCG